jgi:hypothetical protein
MDQIEFASIQRSTSRIGLGCDRLVGGVSARSSRAIIEAALEAGITHFDVAPSYGLGLAEDVVGDVLHGNPGVTIATKFGIARLRGGGGMAVARKFLRSASAAVPKVKRLVLGALNGRANRMRFDVESVEASLVESLKRLKRPKIDFLLLHEPPQSAITPELTSLGARLVRDGLVGALGSSTGDLRGGLIEFGSVWQYRASFAPEAKWPNVNKILHGVLRYGLGPMSNVAGQPRELSYRLGFDLADRESWPALLLTAVMAMQPDALILISSNDPARLKSSVSLIDWNAANNRRNGFLEAFTELRAAQQKRFMRTNELTLNAITRFEDVVIARMRLRCAQRSGWPRESSPC